MASIALAAAADMAHWTGRPIGTIWRWASEGRLTVYGRGRSARYNVLEVDPAVRDEDGNVVSPTPAPPVRARTYAAA